MKFKVGDKVKCMDASNSYLEYGKVYEVSNAFSGACDGYVNLVNGGANGWSTSRFELVKEEVSMHKFKVGDVVNIVGNPYGNNSKWDNTKSFRNVWVQTMDKFVGKVDVISGIADGGVFLESIDTYKFPPQALEIYTEKMKIQKDKKYRVVGTHEPVRIICTDRNDHKASKLQCVALYTYHRGDEGLLLVSDGGLNCWGDKVIEEVPEVDWSKVLIDTPIWVNFLEVPMHFAGYEQGIVWCFKNGRTSHTEEGKLSIPSECAKLTKT